MRAKWQRVICLVVSARVALLGLTERSNMELINVRKLP